MVVDEAMAGAPRARGRRARWLVAGAALVVVALATGWQVLARAPRLEPGPVARYDEQADASAGSRQANDGFVVVTDPADGTYDGLWSFRNTGPVSVTVRLPAAQPAPGLAVRLVRLDPHGGPLPVGGPADAVSVPSGGVVGVEFSLGAGCAPYDPGTGFGVDGVQLRVESLGVDRTVTAASDAPAMVRTTQGIASCRPSAG